MQNARRCVKVTPSATPLTQVGSMMRNLGGCKVSDPTNHQGSGLFNQSNELLNLANID